MAFNPIRFIHVAPPLPRLTLRCPAVDELANHMRALYPNSGALGSMIRLMAANTIELHQGDPTVQGWLFASFADLPSIDRVLALAGISSEVPRPARAPLVITARDMAVLDAGGFPISSQTAVDAACGLFHHVADRVGLISSTSAARILLDGSEAVQ